MASGLQPQHDHAAQVACGNDHTLVLCQSGSICGFGSNCYAQLGLSPSSWALVDRPKKLEPISSQDICSIQCGAHHSLAITRGGSVWTFGSNSSGQTGCGSSVTFATPQPVPFFIGKVAVRIVAGLYHSFVQLQNGQLYGFG